MQAESVNLLEAAKQGNPKAIAALMNRSLKAKGIAVKAFVKDNCLSIFLESVQELDQQSLAIYMYKGLTGLGIRSIKTVKLYGRKQGADFPAWSQEFSLKNYDEPATAHVEIVKSSNSAVQPLKQARTTIQNVSKITALSKAAQSINKPKAIALGVGSVILLLCVSIGGMATWTRSAQSKALAQAAEFTKTIQPADSNLDINSLRSNQDRLEKAISILKNAPSFSLFNLGSWQAALGNNQNQLVAVQQSIEAYEKLLPVVREVVEQFSALDSSLEVGMNYRDYGAEVRNLKIALDRLARQPGATELPVYRELQTAFKEYNFAYDVWEFYFTNDDASHNFLPAYSSVGQALAAEYSVPTRDIVGTPYIYLNTALSTIWNKGEQHVQAAQAQVQ